MRPLPNGLVEVDTENGPLALPPYLAERYASEMPAMAAPPTLAEAGATAATDWSNSEPPPGLMAPPPEAPPQMPDWAKPGAVAKMTGAPVPAKIDPVDPSQVRTANSPSGAPPGPAAPPNFARDFIEQRAAEGPRVTQVAARAAGYVPQQQTTRGTGPISPEAQAALQKAQDAAAQSDLLTGQATLLQNEADFDQVALQAEQSKAALQAEQARQAEVARRRDELNKKLQEKREAVANQELDPNRWDRSGGAGRVLAILATGLSQIGQGLTGVDNGVPQMMRQLSQDDIENQKAAFASQERDLGRTENDFAEFMAEHGDPILAERQLEVLNFDKQLKELQTFRQRAKSDAANAAVDAWIEQNRADRALAFEQAQGRAQEVVTVQAYDPGSRGGTVRQSGLDYAKELAAYGEAGTKINEAMGNGEMDPKERREVRQLQVIMPDGRTIKYAKDKDAATLARKVFDANREATRLLDELDEIANTPASSVSPEQRARAESIQNQLIKQVGNTLAPGEAISDGERGFYAGMAVDGAAGLNAPGVIKARIKAAREMFGERANATERGWLYDDQDTTQPTATTLRPEYGER